MKCPSCGKENREGIKFCPNCGAKLEQANQESKQYTLRDHIGIGQSNTQDTQESETISKSEQGDNSKKIKHPIATFILICCVGICVFAILGSLVSPDLNTSSYNNYSSSDSDTSLSSSSSSNGNSYSSSYSSSGSSKSSSSSSSSKSSSSSSSSKSSSSSDRYSDDSYTEGYWDGYKGYTGVGAEDNEKYWSGYWDGYQDSDYWNSYY